MNYLPPRRSDGTIQHARNPRMGKNHSHSIVPGGLLVMS